MYLADVCLLNDGTTHRIIRNISLLMVYSVISISWYFILKWIYILSCHGHCWQQARLNGHIITVGSINKHSCREMG